MNRVYKCAALVFLVLWVPITSHCYLEKIPGLEFLQCASETPGNSNCEGDGCQTVESGLYKISDRASVAPVPIGFVILITVVPEVPDVSADGRAGILTCLPPELPQSWQFISRTALPVRAPSFAS